MPSEWSLDEMMPYFETQTSLTAKRRWRLSFNHCNISTIYEFSTRLCSNMATLSRPLLGWTPIEGEEAAECCCFFLRQHLPKWDFDKAETACCMNTARTNHSILSVGFTAYDDVHAVLHTRGTATKEFFRDLWVMHVARSFVEYSHRIPASRRSQFISTYSSNLFVGTLLYIRSRTTANNTLLSSETWQIVKLLIGIWHPTIGR